MISAEKEQAALKETLAVCEECLESPVVPGEAVDWVNALEKAFERLATQFNERVRKTHSNQLDEIASQDSGLLTRVEEMRSEDKAIAQELGEVVERLRHVAKGIAETEPNEVKAEPALEKLSSQGIELIIRIRKQELAIGTWLVEAFQRDRGVAD